MSHQDPAAIWRSHRNNQASKSAVPVALSVAMGLAAMAVLGLSEPAQAIECGGDPVGPSDDPIVLDTNLKCDEADSPALTIVGPVVVNLRGHTISCAVSPAGDAPDETSDVRVQNGELTGIGIDVQGTLAVIRNGRIKNCLIGVLVEGDGSHLLRRLTVTSSPGVSGDEPMGVHVTSDYNVLTHDVVREHPGEGFRLDEQAAFNVLKYNKAIKNAGEGFRLDEEAAFNVLKYNKAIKNGDHGFQVRDGQNNLFVWNEAIGNQSEGFRSRGEEGSANGNRFVRNMAEDNGDDGIRIRADENLVVGNIVKHNGLVPCDPEADDANAGIAITNDGSGNFVRGNKSRGNCIGIGVKEGSHDNKIVGNLARKNTLVDMADENFDCDENIWFRNIFRTSAAPPDGLCIQ